MTGIADAAVVLGARRVAADAYAAAHGFTPFRGMRTQRLPDADEDALTLAVDAVRRLTRDRELADVGQLLLVGAFTDADAAVLTEALDAPHLAVAFFAGGPTAGADALLMALNGPATPATLVVAADDARGGLAGSPRGAGAVALWLDARGPVRLDEEVHRRTVAEDPAVEAITALRTDAGAAPWVVVEDVPGAARRQVPRDIPLVPTALPDVGNMGAAEALTVLVQGLSAPEAEAGLVWLVPGTDTMVGVRFRGRLAPSTSVRAALSAPFMDSDPGVAVRALHAWEGAEASVAQGAHVSRQAWALAAAARYRLEGQRCTACQKVLFPPRESCSSCGAAALAPLPLSGRGKVYARTRVSAGGGPTEFDPLQKAVGDYDVVLVELAEGPRVAMMCSGPPGAFARGDEVEAVLRLLYVQDGMRRYGFKARRARS